MRSNILLVGLLLSFTSFSQIKEVKRITEELCSPEFHGRGYVHQGDSIAASFLKKEFEKLGVGAYKKNYFQSFEFPVNRFPDSMQVKVNGKVLTPGMHFMVDPASGSSHLSLTPFRIDAATAMDPEKLISSIRRVMASNKYNSFAVDLAGVSADTLKELRGISQELGNVSKLPILEIIDSKFTWSVAQYQFEFPLIQIQDSIFQWEQDVTISIDAEFVDSYHTQNVIAYIPGKKKSKNTIVFTAHYDHLGRMGADTYFPGANDNASGTAMLFTMAKHFKENPANCNVMFIAFAGEEAGLVGSKYFVEHPIIKLNKIKFLVNLDIMGSGEEGITVVNATLFEDEFKMLQEINEEKQLLAKVKKRGPAANSDHYWFTENGVPAFFIYTMGPNKHYHDVFDTYDELSFSEYHDITTLLIDFVRKIEQH